MKRLYIALLTTLLLLSLCSCTEQVSAENTFDLSPDLHNSEIEMDLDSCLVLEHEANSMSWLSTNENDHQTFRKDYDGIVLTVTTDKSEYASDESVKIKAALKNNTEKEIYVYYAASRNRYPIEFDVELIHGSKHLITDGPRFIFRGAAMVIDTVAPGEELTDYITYLTYYPNAPGSKASAESGTYNGSCCIRLCSEPDYPYGDVTKYSIDFSVTLV